jgi:hypothetical protein
MDSARDDCCSCLDEGEAFAADADACDSGCSFMAAKGEGLRSDMGGDVEAPTCEDVGQLQLATDDQTASLEQKSWLHLNSEWSEAAAARRRRRRRQMRKHPGAAGRE